MYKRIFTSLLFTFIILNTSLSAQSITLTDKDLIRNGDFEHDIDSWFERGCRIMEEAAHSGNSGIRMGSSFSYQKGSFFFQQIIFPSKATNASISFDYRSISETSETGKVEFQVFIGNSTGFDSFDINSPPFSQDNVIFSKVISEHGDWQHIDIQLSEALLSSIQLAHDSGKYNFILFQSAGIDDPGRGITIDIDNLSFLVKGTQNIPEMSGAIAFVGNDDEGKPKSINILEPNTKKIKTIWSHPDKAIFPWNGVAWKPDSSEIAFVSDHEHFYSPLYTDLYSIKPDGTNLRRISNTPSQEEILKGEYRRITLTGVVKNLDELPATLIMWIQGAETPIPLRVDGYGVKEFEIPNVAVLGESNLFSQEVVFYWSNSECSKGLDYAKATGAIIDSTADVNIPFLQTNCVKFSDAFSVREITWQWDGTRIGFSLMGNLWEIKASGQPDSGTSLKINGLLNAHMARSPVDSSFLFYKIDSVMWGETGLYFQTEDMDSPIRLIDQAKGVTPSWLPDGSGFIYVSDIYSDKNIYEYDMVTLEKKRLTYFAWESISHVSVSNDGNYIAFIKSDFRKTPNEHNLWILNRRNPIEMWQVTNDGKCTCPDWSRTDFSYDDPDEDNSGGDGDDGSYDNDKGNNASGGGGCFVFSIFS